MNFFKWVFSKMFFSKRDDGQTNKTAVATTGGVLITAAMVSAALFLSGTVDEGIKMTAQFEGMVLENYIDTVGVETWCIGETQMGRLETGYTKEYCEQLFYARYTQYSGQLYGCYNEKAKRYVTPAMHAAFTDVYYNTGARCSTGMIRNLKRGKPKVACDYILKYKRAGGKDCSVRANGCWGVWDRRLKFHPKCIKDAEQIPPEGLGAE